MVRGKYLGTYLGTLAPTLQRLQEYLIWLETMHAMQTVWSFMLPISQSHRIFFPAVESLTPMQ